MTTLTTVAPITHGNNTGFRAWGSEFSSALATVGLVQTSDTGQANWASATYSATTNTAIVYEIWRFDDTQQANLPLFLKIEYGTGSTAPTPCLWLTIGTGSNGSGTITGTLFARTQIIPNTNAHTISGAPTVSRWCCVDGMFWVDFKSRTDSVFYPITHFSIQRTCDNTGTATAEGIVLIMPVSGNWIIRSINAAGVSYTPYSPLVPGTGITTTVVGGAIQLFRGQSITPAIKPLFGILAALAAEIVDYMTVTVLNVGTTPRTYMAVVTGSSAGGGKISSGCEILYIWE